MFQYLMKNRIERGLVLAFAIGLALSVGGMVTSSLSTAFESVSQALAPIGESATH